MSFVFQKLRSENDHLKKQLAACQQQLEDETLIRVDLENRLQSLREEMTFNKLLYEQVGVSCSVSHSDHFTQLCGVNTRFVEMCYNGDLASVSQELEETRTKRQTEITEINSALEGEYRQKLQDGLADMRAQFDLSLRQNRKEIEDMYEAKVNSSALSTSS